MLYDEVQINQEVVHETEVLINWLYSEICTRIQPRYQGIVFVKHKETIDKLLNFLKDDPRVTGINIKRKEIRFKDDAYIRFSRIRNTETLQQKHVWNYAGLELATVCYTTYAFNKSTKFFNNYIISRMRTSADIIPITFVV